MLNKTVPAKPYLAPGYDLCWVCHIPISVKKFNLDDQACDMCVVADMKDEIASLKTENEALKAKKPGRPKKNAN